jgi:hypothetical protein
MQYPMTIDERWRLLSEIAVSKDATQEQDSCLPKPCVEGFSLMPLRLFEYLEWRDVLSSGERSLH